MLDILLQSFMQIGLPFIIYNRYPYSSVIYVFLALLSAGLIYLLCVLVVSCVTCIWTSHRLYSLTGVLSNHGEVCTASGKMHMCINRLFAFCSIYSTKKVG